MLWVLLETKSLILSLKLASLFCFYSKSLSIFYFEMILKMVIMDRYLFAYFVVGYYRFQVEMRLL